jgi:uncharacterized protein
VGRYKRNFKRILLSLLPLAFATTAPVLAAEPRFPALTGRVVDEAGIIKPEDKRALETELAALEAKSSDQLVVVTLKSLQSYEIEDFGYRLGRHWGIGQAGGKNNGVILIVAPNERRVRIEVGRGLEPIMTDALSRLIIENRILPAFRRGEVSLGIVTGARDIRDALLGDAEEVNKRAQGFRRPKEIEKSPSGVPVTVIIWALVFLYLFIRMARQPQLANRPGQRRRAGRGGWVIVPSPGSWGQWPADQGGGWSRDTDNDGFRGGGGDFGGGGASGRW